MKTKYILENYDRIIFEIKNPKIIFSNDLIPFLRNFATDSYLIHQVDFTIQNNEINYIVNHPIHNLHPGERKIKIETAESISELDQYLPKIIKELNLSSNQTTWHWSSNNKNTAYIFQDFEIEDLTQEERFFLYCYQTLKKENYLIEKTSKEIAFNFISNAKIEQYIYQTQCALQNLTNELIQKINPAHTAELNQFSNYYDKTDCLKITYIYLEKLHHFIEKEYKTYLNLNNQIPFHSTFINEFKISKTLNKVKTTLLKSNINDQLLKVVLEPILKIEKLNIHGKLTYLEFNCCSKIINELHKYIESEKLTEEVILGCLFDLNFNSLQFFKYITGTILKEVEPIENNVEKREDYFRILRSYHHKICRNTLKYKKDLPPIKKQILNWIEEEITYLNKIIDHERSPVQVSSHMDSHIKFLLDLSVAQIGLVLSILVRTKMINHDSVADLIRFIARHFRTKKTDNIATESLRTKYHSVESSAKIVVAKMLIQMLKIAED